tara:strand:- start:280 stop:507 length:228 start_codon:yes stop_codon:yes gene_type:complete
MEGYGWLNTLYDVAKTGLFTEKGHNSINSVKRQNVYEVMTYLSWSSAKIEYENSVRQGVEAEAKAKSNAANNRRK